MYIDTLFENASFVTLDPGHPRASAVGVLSGRVVGLDDDLDGVKAHARVDLRGATVVPGFNDVHVHVAWLGRTLSEIDLTDLDELGDVYKRVADNVAGCSDESAWILCTGFDHHRFGGHYPDLIVLDRLSQGHPLFMRHTSGHSSVVNSTALGLIGALDPDFHDPDGGRVVRDAEGNPTGLVQENAQKLVQDLFKPYALDTIQAAIERATAKLASEGITSVCDAGIGAGWIGHTPVEFLAYQRAREAGRLSVRAQVMPMVDSLHEVSAAASDGFGIGLDLGIRTGLGDDYLSIGPTKVFSDGSLSGETAAMSEHYRNEPGNYGFLQHGEEFLHRQIIDALTSGWSVATHAIGDRGIDVALDAYEEALSLGIRPVLPLRIEHAGVMRPEQLQRIAHLGVVPTTQSVFFDNMGDGIIDSLDPQQLAWTYRGKSLLDAGIVLPGSSDAPCASESALLGIEKFVTRTTPSGSVIGARSECLSAIEALRCYTVGSAAATGYATSKGRIAPGFLADFTALAENPLDAVPDQISKIPVLATLVGGDFTYQRA